MTARKPQFQREWTSPSSSPSVSSQLDPARILSDFVEAAVAGDRLCIALLAFQGLFFGLSMFAARRAARSALPGVSGVQQKSLLCPYLDIDAVPVTVFLASLGLVFATSLLNGWLVENANGKFHWDAAGGAIILVWGLPLLLSSLLIIVGWSIQIAKTAVEVKKRQLQHSKKKAK